MQDRVSPPPAPTGETDFETDAEGFSGVESTVVEAARTLGHRPGASGPDVWVDAIDDGVWGELNNASDRTIER